METKVEVKAAVAEPGTLKTRRKKAKPTKDQSLFDDKEEKEIVEADIPINNLIKENTKRRGS